MAACVDICVNEKRARKLVARTFERRRYIQFYYTIKLTLYRNL
jgi:hypothetical protein